MDFAYLQDDWRIRDGLTLNAGLRYEYASPQWEANNILSNYDPATRTMIIAKDGSMEEADFDDQPGSPEQLRASRRLRVDRRRTARWSAAATAWLRALQPRRWRQPAADQRSAG